MENQEKKPKIWLYPGSFDPFTLGHLSIVEQAYRQADQVVITILQHPLKRTLFTVEERLQMVRASVRHLPGVTVVADNCLLVDLYRKFQATAIVRGVRNFRDWEYERDYALANQNFLSSCQFVYLAAPATFTYVSSSLVRELLLYDKNIDNLLAPAVAPLLLQYWQNHRRQQS